MIFLDIIVIGFHSALNRSFEDVQPFVTEISKEEQEAAAGNRDGPVEQEANVSVV
jgi:hypothetical protein